MPTQSKTKNQERSQELKKINEQIKYLQELTSSWPAWKNVVTYAVPGVVVEQAENREVS